MANEGVIYINIGEEFKVRLDDLLKSSFFKKFVEKQGFTIKGGGLYNVADNRTIATDEIARLAELAYGKNLIEGFDKLYTHLGGLEEKFDSYKKETSKEYTNLEGMLKSIQNSIDDLKTKAGEKYSPVEEKVSEKSDDTINGKVDKAEKQATPYEKTPQDYDNKKEDRSKSDGKPKSLEENIEDLKVEQERRKNVHEVKDRLDELEEYYANMVKDGLEGQKKIKNLKKTLCNKEDANISGVCGKAAYYAGYGVGYGIGTILGAGIGIIGGAVVGLFGAVIDIGDNAYNNLDKKLKEIKPHY